MDSSVHVAKIDAAVKIVTNPICNQHPCHDLLLKQATAYLMEQLATTPPSA